MSEHEAIACGLSLASVVFVVLFVRYMLRRRSPDDGTWVMVPAFAIVGVFAVVGSFWVAGIEDRADACVDRGGRFVRYLGCVDPATNHPR